MVGGASIRRMYITEQMLKEHGRTDGCPRCENYGATHSEECRRRIEAKMIAAGQAFSPTDKNGETRILVEETKPSLASSSGSNSSSNSSSSTSGSDKKEETPITSSEQVPEPSINMLNEINLVETIALLEEPVSELWRDARAMRKQDFPYEAREAGRQKELNNLRDFEAIEDAVPAKGETTPDMIWVEEYRGDEVRARLCVRQYKQDHRDDVFSGTPDSWIARFQIRRCSADRNRAIAIIDI